MSLGASYILKGKFAQELLLFAETGDAQRSLETYRKCMCVHIRVI